MGQTHSSEDKYNRLTERANLRKTNLYKKFIEYSEDEENIILNFKDKDGISKYILEVIEGDQDNFCFHLYKNNGVLRPEVSLKVLSLRSSAIRLLGQWRPSNFYVKAEITSQSPGSGKSYDIAMAIYNINHPKESMDTRTCYLLMKVKEYYIFKRQTQP